MVLCDARGGQVGRYLTVWLTSRERPDGGRIPTVLNVSRTRLLRVKFPAPFDGVAARGSRALTQIANTNTNLQ